MRQLLVIVLSALALPTLAQAACPAAPGVSGALDAFELAWEQGFQSRANQCRRKIDRLWRRYDREYSEATFPILQARVHRAHALSWVMRDRADVARGVFAMALRADPTLELPLAWAPEGSRARSAFNEAVEALRPEGAAALPATPGIGNARPVVPKPEPIRPHLSPLPGTSPPAPAAEEDDGASSLSPR